MRFFKSLFFCFTISVLTALVNGFLSSGFLFFVFKDADNWATAFLLFFFFTMVFSVPGIFIFWIIMMFNWNKARLFRSLLLSGIIIAALSAFLLLNLYGPMVKGEQLCLSLCAVIAATTSVMMHHKSIKSVYNPIINFSSA